MLNAVGLDIEINRGNAAGLTFHFEGDDTPQDGTAVLFQVRPVSQYAITAFEKEVLVHDGQIDIEFLPADTENLKPGDYCWNACIQYSDGAEPWTLLRDWARFSVLPG